MKAQISRDSHRPAKRYSGVYHIQGGMITDADLDERTDIVKDRTDALGDDTVRDGCPAIGGAVDYSGATPTLGEGDIYADGVRGVFQMTGTGPATSLANAIARQVDFPAARALSNGDRVIYADIWERPVFALEEPYLADPGLHGAETAYRSRTMCQIKHAPQAHTAQIEAGTGRYPQIGNAVLAVTERAPDASVDECDPCSDVVTLDQTVTNTLFRIEVVRVRGGANNPSMVELAWSAENAAAIAPSTVASDAFERAGAVYERFSTTTECHMGALSDSNAIETSTFVDDLDTGGTGGMPFIRRWDGYARLDMNTDTVAQRLGTGFTLTFDGTKAVLTVDAFEAALTLAGKSVLRGDYWLVEMRTFAPPTERARLVSATPIGIRHHYCVLFRSNVGVGEKLTDAERRKISFPALSDLPADHVGFVNSCTKLYAGAENVQQALDGLCDISAADIAFDDNCPRLYGGASDVQTALDNLCKVDFNIETVLRLLMDWGVVCGLTARLLDANSAVIRVAPGWFLDRAGQLANFAGEDVKLTDLIGQLPAAEQQHMIERILKGSACLAVALDAQRKARLHLVLREDASGPPDPGLMEVVHKCIDAGKKLDPRKSLDSLGARDGKVIGKVAMVASETSFGGAQKVDRNEGKVAKKYTDGLMAEFNKIADADDKVILAERVKALDTAFELETAVGETLDILRAKYFADRLVLILESDEERRKRCICMGLFPPCPPDPGAGPHHVPIAAIQGNFEGTELFLTTVCMYACRKQAMTWRSANYYLADCRETVSQQLTRICCGSVTDSAMLKEFNLPNLLRDSKLLECVFGMRDARAEPDLTGLALAHAIDVVTGNGGEVVETVEIADTGAIDRIIEKTGGDLFALLEKGGDFAPGDKLALLTEDGQPRGYLVVERGGGKYAFLPESEKKKLVAKTAPIAGLTKERIVKIGELAEKLGTVTDAETHIDSEITGLAKARDVLVTDVARLKAETEALAADREVAAREIAAANVEFKKLTDAQLATVETLKKARTELGEAETRKDEFVKVMRNNQPVATLGISAAVKARLAARNIFTVEEALKNASTLGLPANQLATFNRRLKKIHRHREPVTG